MSSSTLASVATFAVYFVVMVVIGFWVFKRTASLSDFVLGGRQLNSWVAGLSANASDFSAWLLLGLPGAIYLSGLGEAWIAVGLAIGFAASWYLLAGRLRLFTERATDAGWAVSPTPSPSPRTWRTGSATGAGCSAVSRPS